MQLIIELDRTAIFTFIAVFLAGCFLFIKKVPVRVLNTSVTGSNPTDIEIYAHHLIAINHEKISVVAYIYLHATGSIRTGRPFDVKDEDLKIGVFWQKNKISVASTK